MIEMKDVMKKYSNGTTAIRNLSIVIEQGEFVYVVGPSGAGKSTFIKLMYREEKASKGTLNVAGHDLIAIKNREVPYLRREIGVVFQDYKLLPRKQYMKMLRTLCKLSAENLEISKTSNGSAGPCWFETQSSSLS